MRCEADSTDYLDSYVVDSDVLSVGIYGNAQRAHVELTVGQIAVRAILIVGSGEEDRWR